MESWYRVRAVDGHGSFQRGKSKIQFILMKLCLEREGCERKREGEGGSGREREGEGGRGRERETEREEEGRRKKAFCKLLSPP